MTNVVEIDNIFDMKAPSAIELRNLKIESYTPPRCWPKSRRATKEKTCWLDLRSHISNRAVVYTLPDVVPMEHREPDVHDPSFEDVKISEFGAPEHATELTG